MHRLLNERDVAETEKPVPLAHRQLVRLEHLFAVVERADQHQQRAFGQMKIRNQRVGHLEAIARIDENACIVRHGVQNPVFVRRALQHAAGGRADGNHAPARRAAAVDFVRAFGADRKILAVHDMVADLRLLDRAEGPEPDVQHDRHDGDALFANAVEQLGCEMQPRRRRSRTALLLGVDRLIAAAVLEFFGNIGRQRHTADFVKQRVNFGAARRKGHDAVALLDDVGDFAREQSAAEDKFPAELRLFARTHQRLPRAVAAAAQKEKFDRAVGFFRVCPVKPRGNDLGIVNHQNVLGTEVVDDVVKMLMLDFPAFAVNDHQPRGVARLCGVLRDLVLRQLIKKVFLAEVGFDSFVLYHIARFRKISKLS